MAARIVKTLIIVLIALFLLAVWVLNTALDGVSFGGAPGNPRSHSLSFIDEDKERKMKMDKLEQLKANLEFTCKYEEKPQLSLETQQLYNYALYHDLHLMWTGKKGDWTNDLIRYYRIAAMNGDYKANIRLQYLLKSGRIASDMPQTEVHNLNEELAKQLPATAYYNLYGYWDVGYGVRTEKDGKYAYLRKAADLGSREAQYVVADMLWKIKDEETLSIRKKLVEQLLLCSSSQGLGGASKDLGIDYEIAKKYEKAIDTFYQGTKNGDDSSARRLAKIFKGISKEEYLLNLKLEIDPERARRYEIIARYLSRNDYLQPKVPDLDDIVPLPPAPLPDWDGKIAFQRWFEGEAPPKPDEALIRRLAWQAGLNADTGLDEKTGMPKKPTK